MDKFQEIEGKVRDFLVAIAYEAAEDLSAKIHDDLVKEIEQPDIRLIWTGKTLAARLSYYEYTDAGGEISGQEVELDGLHVDEIDSSDRLYHPDNIGDSIMGSDGNFLTPPEKIECAAFLRNIADAMERIAKE